MTEQTRTTAVELEAALRPVLDDLAEHVRAARKRAFKSLRFSVPIALILGAFVAVAKPEFVWLALGIPLALAVIPVGYRLFRAHGEYKSSFKNHVVRAAVHAFGPELSYNPGGSISQSEFERSEIFPTSPDRFNGEDLIYGEVGDTAVRLSEIHAEEKRRRTRNGRSETYWVTIFRGLFVVADFNKEFSGQTLVLPDRAEKLFGGFGRWLQGMKVGRGELVHLEDPEFERHFVVHTTDQIEARYILSTSLMSRILEYREHVGGEVYMSFLASRLCVAIPLTRDLLEPPSAGDVMNMRSNARSRARVLSQLNEYTADLQLALRLVDDLNLNLRIWSKT